MSRVIVLGAGPAGLMAALQAQRSGHDCTVLEAAPGVGGMAASFRVAGQRVDYGSHRLHPAIPGPLLALIEDLLGDDLQVRQRAGRLRLQDRWVEFPLRFGNLVQNLPPGLTGRLLLDSIRISTPGLRTAPKPVMTFDDEVAARLGPTVAAEFYRPYAHKLYGVEAHRLHPELARRRISASSPSAIARRLARAARPRGRTFLYPRGGYGQIVERLAEAATDAGVTIELDTPVTMVRVEVDSVTVGSPVREIDGDLALSTLPLAALAGVLSPAPSPSVTSALSELRSRAMILVYLVLDRARFTPFDAHYLPGPETRISRLSEPKNYRSGQDPPDRTVLCAEIPCWPGEDLTNSSDVDLGALVVDDLARLGLDRVEPIHVEVRRLGSVYPVYDLAGTGARATVDGWTRMSGRLITLGRQGLGVVDNLHHVLAMGAAAAHSIGADGTVDPSTWHTNLADFAGHTVED